MLKKNPELAAAMARTGLNAQELAEKAGITPDTVCAMLNMRRRPHRLTARAVAAVLGVDVAILFPPDAPLQPWKRRQPRNA